MPELRVDADGLDEAATEIRRKAATLQRIVGELAGLYSAEEFADAAGRDDSGRAFAATHLQAAADVQNGIKIWATAVDDTAKMVSDAAESFRIVDEGASMAATALRDNFTEQASGVSPMSPAESGHAGKTRSTPATPGAPPGPGATRSGTGSAGRRRR